MPLSTRIRRSCTVAATSSRKRSASRLGQFMGSINRDRSSGLPHFFLDERTSHSISRAETELTSRPKGSAEERAKGPGIQGTSPVVLCLDAVPLGGSRLATHWIHGFFYWVKAHQPNGFAVFF